MRKSLLAVGVLFLLLAGCASYSWRSGVPERMRTVAVPTMRNESDVTELGSVMTRQLLREFQREGTFEIRREDDAALEVQGIVKSVSNVGMGYSRRAGLRVVSYDMSAVVEISVIDRVNGRVLVDNRPYQAETTVSAAQDLLTANRDASGRLADDLARQVVDDILNLKW